MNTYDTASTSLVLHAFKAAWIRCTTDYIERRINSEHCLQSSLYRHLLNELSSHPEYKVFVETVILLSETAKDESPKKKVIVDLLVCENSEIVAAIELKYTPRATPKSETVTKDLTSLSHITNRKEVKQRCEIKNKRYRNDDQDSVPLTILSARKIIFAAFCTEESSRLQEDEFWHTHRPKTGYWKDNAAIPPNLAIALSLTNNTGGANPVFFGRAFDRLK